MRYLFFVVFFLYLWLGYIFNAVLPIGFFDEIVLVLFVFLLSQRNNNKEMLFFYGISLFYIVYSLFYSVNRSYPAIISDAIQQIKPYVFFYTFYLYHPHFTRKQIKWFNYSIYIGVLLTIASFFYDSTYYSGLYTHPAEQGNCMFSFAMFYYFINDHDKKTSVVTVLILILGLLSTRSKYYGEFIIAIYFLFLVKKKIKFNLKYIFAGCLVFLLLIVVSWEKIQSNFYLEGDYERSARAVLYACMPKVLIDYFPFGSGLASYATYFSGEYYSPLYDKLKISDVWGISRSMKNFIADTFFPSLAQLGIVGVALYICFWRNRILSIIRGKLSFNYKIGFAIFLYFMIDGVAAPGFVTVYSFIPLYILAKVCRASDFQSANIHLFSYLEKV